MANQETEKSSPKVSKLPLPISDSPLVIDLPDGQKIVVGKMVQGSVIEVATWRGVGRPDSRTSRLMLGMGSGNVNEDAETEQSSSSAPAARAPQKPAGVAGYIATAQHFIRNFNRINWSATFKALLASFASKKTKKAKTEPTTAVAGKDEGVRPEITVTPSSQDADIEAWLNKISEKATRDSAKTKSTPAKKAPAKAVVKKAAPKSSSARTSKK